MPTDIAALVELLKNRAKELGLLHALLHFLEGDIETRRALEAFQRVPFLARHSVRVERSREAVQEQVRQVEAEIDGLAELMVKMARNEAAQ
jgi:hypothetical protein